MRDRAGIILHHLVLFSDSREREREREGERVCIVYGRIGSKRPVWWCIEVSTRAAARRVTSHQ
jgi:hypothetical protein